MDFDFDVLWLVDEDDCEFLFVKVQRIFESEVENVLEKDDCLDIDMEIYLF